MKPRGLSVAAQLGLLGAMNTEKEREQNRAEVAFCNHARMAIHMQGRDPLDMEWGPELNEEGMKLVEIPSYAFTPRVEGSAELHLFGSKSEIRFLTEKHRCPNSHCDRVYAFWRAELHDDAHGAHLRSGSRVVSWSAACALSSGACRSPCQRIGAQAGRRSRSQVDRFNHSSAMGGYSVALQWVRSVC